MDNPSFKDDEGLPIQNAKNSERSFNLGIFTWREIIQGLFAKHPKSFHTGTLLTLGAVFHAYFFFCLYRYNKHKIVFGLRKLKKGCSKANFFYDAPHLQGHVTCRFRKIPLTFTLSYNLAAIIGV